MRTTGTSATGFFSQIHQMRSFQKIRKMEENSWNCLKKIIGESVISSFDLLFDLEKLRFYLILKISIFSRLIEI